MPKRYFGAEALLILGSERLPLIGTPVPYLNLWEWFVKIRCNGGTAVNIMPYYLLALDAKQRTPASPLNLIIMGDFDDLSSIKSKKIGKFLEFYEKEYGELNVTVIVIGKDVNKDNYSLIETPRSEGGLGGVFINIPYGGSSYFNDGAAINPKIIIEKIKEAVLRPNSPLRKLKFKTRI